MEDQTASDNCTARVIQADCCIAVSVIGKWNEVDSTQVVSEEDTVASIVSAGPATEEDENYDDAEQSTTYSFFAGSRDEQLALLAKKLVIVGRSGEDENLSQLLRRMQAELRAERVEAP